MPNVSHSARAPGSSSIARTAACCRWAPSRSRSAAGVSCLGVPRTILSSIGAPNRAAIASWSPRRALGMSSWACAGSSSSFSRRPLASTRLVFDASSPASPDSPSPATMSRQLRGVIDAGSDGASADAADADTADPALHPDGARGAARAADGVAGSVAPAGEAPARVTAAGAAGDAAAPASRVNASIRSTVISRPSLGSGASARSRRPLSPIS